MIFDLPSDSAIFCWRSEIIAFTPDPPGFDICWMGVCSFLFDLKLGLDSEKRFFKKKAKLFKSWKSEKKKIITILGFLYLYSCVQLITCPAQIGDNKITKPSWINLKSVLESS